MNEKGESTLFCVLLLLALSSLVILCSLELHKSYRLLEKRTEILLCLKETKGEFERYFAFMGRTNWAIKNIRKAQLIAFLIPGLQGAALNADKIKKIITHAQDLSLLAYFKKLNELKDQNCPLDPRMILTPFELGVTGYKRDLQSAALLRKEEWTYLFLHLPYGFSLTINASQYEALSPKIEYLFKESEVTSSFLSYFAY
jgi:hypothetical protein